EPGPHKRSAAAQLNVDVFSTNPYLQQVLDEIARMRSAGRLRNPVAPAGLRPLVPAFGSGVFDAELKAIIKNNSVAELNAKLETALADMEVDKAVRLRFLGESAFSPTRRLYLISYLELLESTEQRGEVVKAGLAARTEADALAFVNAVRMLAYYHLRVTPLVRIVTTAGVIAAVDRGGQLLAALPVDYLAWTADTAAIARLLSGLSASAGAGGIEILLAGSPSERAGRQLGSAGITVRESFSLP
ncbi:MAG: hypothetical protein HKO62_11375, partial [Gammaproteobacteria bacterium]|nr:hypothetical protein [Gammaproteobacteria bacterium]